MAIVEEGKKFETCVVFGGRGFIGKPLVDRLLRLGNWIVRIADSFPTIQLEPSESLLSHALSSGRASYAHVDVRHKSNIITESGEGYVPNVVALHGDENLEPWSEAMWMMMMVAQTINTKRSQGIGKQNKMFWEATPLCLF